MNELYNPWPWYIAGPIIGSMVPLMLLIGNRRWGMSATLRHVAAACSPIKPPHLRYDWKKDTWSLLFVVGVVLGGFVAARFFPNGDVSNLSPRTVDAIAQLGFNAPHGLVPAEAVSLSQVATYRGFLMMVVGGLLVGFGTRYANGCTSGHAISGLSFLQWQSLVATIAFFAGGLLCVHVLYPVLF